MRFVIQRVTEASVTIEDKLAGQIGKGFLVLFGACESDTKEIADKMIKKMANMRIFEDENGKTNRALADVGGEILFVSQFTLYADCKKGNRPSFTKAGNPAHAESLYEYAKEQIQKVYQIPLQTGEFGADMKVRLLNDGPFTIVLDSDEIC